MPLAKPWRWIKKPDDPINKGERELLDPQGRCRATVWPNGTWHTWDTDGVGGENDQAVSHDGEVARPMAYIMRDAMDCALAAVVRQGWTKLNLIYQLNSTEKKT